ncbi:MAG: hypothetical protein KatS3mg105_2101 [Gemmatales bacterium]|nr:MAG: hypothetical protein KatS3mg105_2101 [Gemmatales bacterium]
MARRNQAKRAGAVVPLVAISMVGLLGCVALAIDLGLLALARQQAQHAADVGAMAGARTLNGDVANNNNFSNVLPEAKAAIKENLILTNTINDSDIDIQIGSYTYDENTEKFTKQIPKNANDNYSLVQATVSFTGQAAFSKIFGVNFFSTQATATAVHRPRDVAIILDFSGSMRFDSLLGIPYYGDRTMSNNPEDVYPRFGHYSDESAAALEGPDTFTVIDGNAYGPANITVTTDSGPPIVEDFYQHVAGSTTYEKAFTPAPDSYENTPGGDNFLTVHGDPSTYAKTLQEITNGAVFNGYTNPPYAGYSGATIPEFAGYIQGPRYWGKTFFIWPPDPRQGNDWREKFFGTTDNTRLWESNGNFRTPGSGSYTINYAAILDWIKNVGPNPFPPRLRAGRILYYDNIPDNITSNFPTDQNERFWKEYIDYVIGVWQDSSTSWHDIYRKTGYGDDFEWSGDKITAPPTGDTTDFVANNYSAGYSGKIYFRDYGFSDPDPGHRVEIPTGSNKWYTVTSVNKGSNWFRVDRPLEQGVDRDDPIRLQKDGTIPGLNFVPYLDNPERPRLHFWFGPMTMVDFLGNYNLATGNQELDFRWPGTAHEAPLYSLKLGIQAALIDIQNNHPNDSVSLTFFSVPQYYDGYPYGRFNRVRGPLGRTYKRYIDSLFFPPNTILDDNGTAGPDINPYDKAVNEEVPRAEGGTCPAMSFMHVFNQFSLHSSLKNWAPPPAPTGEAGGLGRKGSQKLIVFETDGVANTRAYADFVQGAPHKSYYKIRQPGEYPSSSGSDVFQQVYDIVDKLVADESTTGYSTTRKPVLIHCLAFGTLFEPAVNSPNRQTALDFLQEIQFRGHTQDSPSTPLESYKMIVGNDQQRIQKLRDAFRAIMQDGVQVSLIE